MGTKTEAPHPQHAELDQYPAQQMLDAFVDDQLQAVQAVRASTADLARAVQAAVPRLAAGGRLIYVGAGTSGRLGMLDSVELHPTFSWPRDRSIALLAGGLVAMRESVEGAEDDFDKGAADMLAARADKNDVVLAIAASGSTPYVLGALGRARSLGALTIGIANNTGSPLAAQAEIGVTLDTGPEVISGSTRLKAGTAQKIALNSFSSAVMVGLNKVYGNLMVDLRATNAKLRRRALELTMRASGADQIAAQNMLEDCGYRIKVAIVALKRGVDARQAQELLDSVEGSVRRAISA